MSDITCRAALAGFAIGAFSLAGVAVCFKAALWGRHFMAILPLFLWGLACTLTPARHPSRNMSALALWALGGLFLLSSFRQRVLDEYRKDPLREAVSELTILAGRNRDMPAVVLAYPLAVWYYVKSDADMVPVVGWEQEKVLLWQKIHDSYFILIHRADKVDPSGLWSSEVKRRHADLVWMKGNARIYRVQRDRSLKGH